MAAQTNYNYSTPKGVPGAKADITMHEEVVTRMNEEADGTLKYGMVAMIGTTPGHNVKVANGATAVQIEGVVLHAANTEQDMNGNVLVRQNTSVGIIRKGHVWGRIATGVAPTYGETAYVVVSGDDAGTFTNVADDAVDIGAKFGKNTDDGIAVIELY